MKQVIFLMLLFGFFMQLQSCISKNEVELYECDTTKVSYANDVRPIIKQNCDRCHDVDNAVKFGNMHYLDTYDSLKGHISEGMIIGNIEHAPGFSEMPKGAAKLKDCDIYKIKAWVHQDTLNN
jgi:hypothetical protein